MKTPLSASSLRTLAFALAAAPCTLPLLCGGMPLPAQSLNYVEVKVPDQSAPTLSDATPHPLNESAFAFAVPAHGKLLVKLDHPARIHFRVFLVDRLGRARVPGLLQNLHPKGGPEASFLNPSNEAQAIYLIVQDPRRESDPQNPFTLSVERSWDPAQVKVSVPFEKSIHLGSF